MHFCKKCENMYYIKINDNGELIYYCRKCNYEDINLAKNVNNLCVSKININKISDSYHNTVNEYTKFDPTLPRTKLIKCNNILCKTNQNINTESEQNIIDSDVIYIRYDDNNMKYIYLCPICDNTWEIK